MYTKRVTIVDTDRWEIESLGNGLAYRIHDKQEGSLGFVQDEDAREFRKLMDDMDHVRGIPESCFYERSLDECLSFVVYDFSGVQMEGYEIDA